MAIEIIAPGVNEHETAAVSYSAFTSWLSCGKAYQLERVLGVKANPAWYFVGGSVVHSVTEVYDRALFEAEGK